MPENESVNEGINKEFTAVKYETLHNANSLVQKFGKGCLIAKSDIEEAFRIVPVHPSNYNILGFRDKKNVYYDILPMGCSASKLKKKIQQSITVDYVRAF